VRAPQEWIQSRFRMLGVSHSETSANPSNEFIPVRIPSDAVAPGTIRSFTSIAASAVPSSAWAAIFTLAILPTIPSLFTIDRRGIPLDAPDLDCANFGPPSTRQLTRPRLTPNYPIVRLLKPVSSPAVESLSYLAIGIVSPRSRAGCRALDLSAPGSSFGQKTGCNRSSVTCQIHNASRKSEPR